MVVTTFAAVEALHPTGLWGHVFHKVKAVEGRVALGLLVLMALSWLYKIAIMPLGPSG